MKPELYVSLDIETDGPAPFLNSMLSLGAAAFMKDQELKRNFYATMYALEMAHEDSETMAWWRTQPRAWEAVQRSRQRPQKVMQDFATYIRRLANDYPDYKLVAVAWPAAYDFAFVNAYCHLFLHENPLGFACMDLRSYTDGLANGAGYYALREAEVRTYSGPVFKDDLTEHIAVDDAVEQGRLLLNLLALAERKKNEEKIRQKELKEVLA